MTAEPKKAAAKPKVGKTPEEKKPAPKVGKAPAKQAEFNLESKSESRHPERALREAQGKPKDLAPAAGDSSGAKARSQNDGKTIKVTQLVGTIARKWDQQATLKGLGLGKRHRSRVLQDTPEVRGMIYKVRHLVKVENGS